MRLGGEAPDGTYSVAVWLPLPSLGFVFQDLLAGNPAVQALAGAIPAITAGGLAAKEVHKLGGQWDVGKVPRSLVERALRYGSEVLSSSPAGGNEDAGTS